MTLDREWGGQRGTRDPRVRDDRADRTPLRGQSPLKFQGEQDDGELGFPVGVHRMVFPGTPVQVGEVEMGLSVQLAGDVDDPVADVRAAADWSAGTDRRSWSRSGDPVRPGSGAAGTSITPALLTSTSRVPVHDPANSRTEVRLATSRRRTSTAPPRSANTLRAVSTLRTPATTCAPAPTRSRVTTCPSPPAAPVTSTVRPVWSGNCSFVHMVIHLRVALSGVGVG